MKMKTDTQDAIMIDTFAIEREARALRAEAMRAMAANLRGWLSEKLSGGAAVSGKTA
ncbi:hypothetical protein C8N43_2812 [Litoreibacter ponti]|uniref:Uncharacterized protein n=1 Tax=Litoreibacter ponti TaxID=1510457 RepID=A0A2T6BD60_9RHOB|nr:hypothetical protein [Litoreibacter ponti]PTX54007.1 hypothetical protein C8N43_2812 [Litoreibacter ponti]